MADHDTQAHDTQAHDTHSVDLRGTGAAAYDPAGTHTRTIGSSDVPEAPAESVGELVKGVAQDLSTLMRQEVALAKAELTEEAKKAGKGAGMLGGAGFAGWMTALFASLALTWLLGGVMPDSLAALIVALLWGAVGAVLFLRGRQQLQQVDPAPRETIETVKEDVQWARTRNA